MASAPLELLASSQLPMSGACTLQVGVVEQPRRHFEDPAELARWDALAHWAAGPNPFHESWYLLPALRAFDPAGEVTLLCLEADGQLHDALALVFGETRRAAATVMREERVMLQSDPGPEEYLEQSLSGKKRRKELRRQHTRRAN